MRNSSCYGDGVRDIALWVDDARDAYAKAVERGAVSAYEPRAMRDDDGEVVIAGIKIYGDTIHSLVERRNYRGPFLPGLSEARAALSGASRPDCCTSTTASATSSSGR